MILLNDQGACESCGPNAVQDNEKSQVGYKVKPCVLLSFDTQQTRFRQENMCHKKKLLR